MTIYKTSTDQATPTILITKNTGTGTIAAVVEPALEKLRVGLLLVQLPAKYWGQDLIYAVPSFKSDPTR